MTSEKFKIGILILTIVVYVALPWVMWVHGAVTGSPFEVVFGSIAIGLLLGLFYAWHRHKWFQR